jgi:hypothetical protein
VLILGLAVGAALVAHASAATDTKAAPAGTTSIFFYPWYSTPQVDGFYKHWDRGGHVPPADLASTFYPVRGVYSSSDPAVLRAQMKEIAGAGIDEVVSSWWGVGSPEDRRLPAVIEAAKAQGLRVAAQLEPYDEGRTPTSVTADITRLRELGVTRIYVYRPFDIDPASWPTLISGVPDVQFLAQTVNVPWAAAAGFDGVYTYDIVTYGGTTFGKLCARARAAGLLCAPSVGPGYDALRTNGDTQVRPRRNGATYDAMWDAAIRASPDLVTITSYNEWHEGTQIEPALASLPRTLASRPVWPTYQTYQGAYGLQGRVASRAYLVRTAYWTRQFRTGQSPKQTRKVVSKTLSAAGGKAVLAAKERRVCGLVDHRVTPCACRAGPSAVATGRNLLSLARPSRLSPAVRVTDVDSVVRPLRHAVPHCTRAGHGSRMSKHVRPLALVDISVIATCASSSCSSRKTSTRPICPSGNTYSGKTNRPEGGDVLAGRQSAPC